MPWKLLQAALSRSRCPSPIRVPPPGSASPVPPGTPPTPHSPLASRAPPAAPCSPLASPFLKHEARKRFLHERWEPLVTGFQQQKPPGPSRSPEPPGLESPLLSAFRRSVSQPFTPEPMPRPKKSVGAAQKHTRLCHALLDVTCA